MVSVRNGALCRPVRSFSKVARQVRIKDEDGRHSVVPSGLFWNLPHTSEWRTVPSAVPRRLPLFSAVPYQNMSQIVGLVVLPNDGLPGNSRMRTDGILSFRPVIFSSCPTSRNEIRGRTTFCRPVPSRTVGRLKACLLSAGWPGRLQTLISA